MAFLLLTPAFIWAQSASDQKATTVKLSSDQNAVDLLKQKKPTKIVLTAEQKTTYVNVYWFKYETMGQKEAIDRLCPNFPKLTDFETINSKVSDYNTAVENWTLNHHKELIDFELTFHPDYEFHHGDVNRSGRGL